MEKDIAQVLISEDVLQQRVKELAAELNEKYAGKNPVFVGVMKGVVLFFADMVKQINTLSQIDFMWISSYAGTNSTGSMVVKRALSTDIKGRHVVILEDIFDTGNSLQFTYNHLLEKEPASLEICTLLDKPSRRNPAVTVKPNYVGFEVPDAFVVGYGLDYNEYYRNLPYIGVLRPEVYEK
jgi:hypoxanthine phosphoribosyltransferase